MDVDLLIRDSRWLRRLAQGLLRDEASVDDVLQQTWLASREAPPRDDRAHRSWLRTVVRRLAARQHRDAMRRRQREEKFAPSEAMPDTASLVQRAEMQRRINEAVLELGEPYRSTVLLRYFEDLTSEEIARRDGIPAATVRTRLHRGLEMLRARLDASYGKRDQWALLLLPLARPSSTASVASAIAVPVLLTGALTMAMKITLSSLAALILAGALWFLWDDSTEPSLVVEDEFARTIEIPEAGSPQKNLSSRSTPIEGEAAPEEQSAESPNPIPEPEITPASPEVLGKLVRIDESGARVPVLDGEFRFNRKAQDLSKVIAVENGQFSLAKSFDEALFISNIVADGKKAYPLDEEHLIEDGQLEVRVRWLPVCHLRVVSEETGQDLDQLEILEDISTYRHTVHPGHYRDINVYAREATSPIELPIIDGVQSYWARSPGYAWGHVNVDHRSGGTQTLALRRGGELVVSLIDFDPKSGAVVRLVPGDHQGLGKTMVEVEPHPGQPIVFSSLEAGEYQIRVEIGLWYDPPTRLGTAQVKVVEGQRTDVEIELDKLPDRGEKVEITGRLILPETEDMPELSLYLRPTGRPPGKEAFFISRKKLHESPDDPLALTWSASVLPGVWQVRINPLQLAEHFEIGPEGRRDIEIRIPELAEVLVHVVDELTREEIPGGALVWMRPRPAFEGVWSLETVTKTKPGEPVRFVAPVGNIYIAPYAPGYREVQLERELHPGVNELTAELERESNIFVSLSCEGTNVPYGWDMPIEVEPIDGEGQGEVKTIQRGKAVIEVDRPGRYRLKIGPLEGFAPVRSVEVTIGEGEQLETDVELFRKQ
ncbi:MAG: RNA polymerase sigma factor [Planctomycetota bacterium]